MIINEIRVLHCLDSLNKGGIETWLMNLNRLKNSRLKLDFYLHKKNSYFEKEAMKLGSTIYYAPKINRFLKFIGLGIKLKSFKRVVINNNYDVVHAHGTEFLGDTMKAAKLCGVKVRVAHCHTTGIGRFNKNIEMKLRGIRFRTLDRYRILKLIKNFTY